MHRLVIQPELSELSEGNGLDVVRGGAELGPSGQHCNQQASIYVGKILLLLEVNGQEQGVGGKSNRTLQ